MAAFSLAVGGRRDRVAASRPATPDSRRRSLVACGASERRRRGLIYLSDPFPPPFELDGGRSGGLPGGFGGSLCPGGSGGRPGGFPGGSNGLASSLCLLDTASVTARSQPRFGDVYGSRGELIVGAERVS